MGAETDAWFFLAIAAAYVSVCGTWWLASATGMWPISESQPVTDRKWFDLAMIPVTVFAVFAMGELYRRDWLMPSGGDGPIRDLAVAINLCLPFLPIPLVLWFRRQSTSTVLVEARGITTKLIVGLLAAMAGLIVYQAAMGDLDSFGAVLAKCGSRHSLMHAPAVFLEGVAIAFVYERLRWAVGGAWSIWVPSLLFALAHVPRSVDAGRPMWEIAVWFAFNTGLPAMILTTLSRSRDVIWIAVPHYVLDVAIRAFE